MRGIPSALAFETPGATFLSRAFERLRPKLVAMLDGRAGRGLSVAIDPEGVVHDAYLRAVPRWLGLNPKPRDVDAWIRGQVRDRRIELTRAALRRRRDLRRSVERPFDPLDAVAGEPADTRTGPGTALSRSENREMVRRALKRLSPQDQEILSLHFFEGLNFEEVGKRVGLSQNTANKRAIAALLKLRDFVPPAYRPSGPPRP